MIARFLSRIGIRLLLFNVLLVFLPVAGLFSLRSLEKQLLDLQERSMVQQGRLVAAALAGHPAVTREHARSIVENLEGRSESRIRVFDARRVLVGDSATIRIQAPRTDDSSPAAPKQARENVLYRLGAALWAPVRRVAAVVRGWGDPGTVETYSDTTPFDVLQSALDGRYGATLRVSAGQRSLTLYSAVPIRARGSDRVIGAVVVSQSTSRILRTIWSVRLDIFEIFVISVIAAIVLSLLVSATISRPLVRLRDEADELLDHRGRLKGTFRGSKRYDEIGDLARALEKLTGRLERHLVFVESFSADVSHEFKNPLASIRSAAELLAQTNDPKQREPLTQTIEREVARLNRLLNSVREVSRVDAALDTEPVTDVDLGGVIREAVARVHHPVSLSGNMNVNVAASSDRLVQAFTNVLENAASFSPADQPIQISSTTDAGTVVIRVDDHGPGIPEEHLERIFDRFFTFRDGNDRQSHDGLGLAIARAIVEGYGGSISASNLTRNGARIEIRLPMRASA